MRVRDRGQEIAVGAADGTVSLLRLSPALVEPQLNEKATMSAVRAFLADQSGRCPQAHCVAVEASIFQSQSGMQQPKPARQALPY